jgi:hypothetical protein
MTIHRHAGALGLALVLLLLALPAAGVAQGRSGRDHRAPAAAQASVTLTAEMRAQIRDFYAARGESGTKALPPGIRRNLARGKPLPPGIAKKVAPAELISRVRVPEGYELVEVGLDVVLVEVATHVIHDVLMDVIR